MNSIIYLAETTKFVDEYGDDIWGRFFGHGLQTAALGMITVFAVLCIIWGFLELFRVVFYRIENKVSTEKTLTEPAVPVVPETAEEVAEDDGEIVAAIVAAVTQMRADEQTASPAAFRVVSFRKRRLRIKE